jgi:glycerol-3-phosphate dehydrogenase
LLKRDISLFSEGTFDVVVVGGGIFGACAAREAALAGLSVALIEKNDFSHATSANHFKMVHCGIRYLQHLDVQRLLESSYERSALLRIAPHLVQTVPIVIPTYGIGLQGKLYLGAGMLLYDLLTQKRNDQILDDKRILPTRFLSKSKLLSLFPNIKDSGLTGGAAFDEGQMYNLPRLSLAFIHSAAEMGAVVANYAKATGLLRKNGGIAGIKGVDQTTGELFEIRARCVLNTAGPWAHRLLASDQSVALKPAPTFSRDLAFTLPRKFNHGYGVALPSETKDNDVLMDRGGRHLFAVPWRNSTLVGVWHKVFDKAPEEIRVEDDELEQFQNEVEGAYPGLCSNIDEIQVINTGLTLFGDNAREKKQGLSFGKRSMLVDHARINGVDGLVTLIGVRATTARGMAAKAIRLITSKLGMNFGPNSDSAYIPVWGGDFNSFDQVKNHIKSIDGIHLSAKEADALAHNYGSNYIYVLKYISENIDLALAFPGTTTIKAEIVHGVREEMALTLKDMVFRRTDLGTDGKPEEKSLSICADIMASELGWSEEKKQNEINGVNRCYPRLG